MAGYKGGLGIGPLDIHVTYPASGHVREGFQVCHPDHLENWPHCLLPIFPTRVNFETKIFFYDVDPSVDPTTCTNVGRVLKNNLTILLCNYITTCSQ